MYSVVYEYRLRGRTGSTVVPFPIYSGADKSVVDALMQPENVAHVKQFRPTLIKIVVLLDNQPQGAILVR